MAGGGGGGGGGGNLQALAVSYILMSLYGEDFFFTFLTLSSSRTLLTNVLAVGEKLFDCMQSLRR